MLYRNLFSTLLCLVFLTSAEKMESGPQKYWVEEGTAIVTLKVVTSNPGLTRVEWYRRNGSTYKIESSTKYRISPDGKLLTILFITGDDQGQSQY
ncbi:hypothetical protein ACHWQZ_G004626 [Mnemiopsis leidyi]